MDNSNRSVDILRLMKKTTYLIVVVLLLMIVLKSCFQYEKEQKLEDMNSGFIEAPNDLDIYDGSDMESIFDVRVE